MLSVDELFTNNGIAGMLKKLRTSKGSTGSSSSSLQLRPFLKWEILLMEREEKFLMVWKITFTTIGGLP